MRIHSLVLSALGALAVAALAGACDNPVSRLPPRPSTPVVLAIEISGPGSIAPGQSAQFTATVRLSDGTRKVATAASGLRWSTDNTSVLRVDTAGVATAQQRLSETNLRVKFSSTGSGAFLQGTREIVVVPDGTFRVVGVVSDETPDAPLADARVEVTSPSVSAMTNALGQYRLYGVPSNAEIRVTRNGYEPATRTLELGTHATQNFLLKLSSPRLVLSGRYRLEIDAGGCLALPADLRRREYDAMLTPLGPSVIVELTDPHLVPNASGRGNRFFGHVEATAASFTLEPHYLDYYYYYYYYGSYPSVVERLSDGTYFVIQGAVVMTGSATRLSGQLADGLYVWDSRFPTGGSVTRSCTTPKATFTLIPR